MTSSAATALLDQVTAAARDAQARMRAQAARQGQALVNIAGDPWARGIVLQVTAAAIADQLRCCAHAGSPRPLVTAAWQPDTVVCGACVGVFALAGAEDRRCDRCGVDAVARHGAIHPNLLNVGPLLIACGLCPPCLNATRAASRHVP